MSGINLSDFIPEYLAEVREHLIALERGLLALEATPEGESRMQIIHTIFRAAHTIKGSSRMVGYESVARVAHAMEDVLGVWRAGRLAADPASIDGLLRGVDHLRR